MKFTDLGLNAELLRAVADAGYESPTPIQQQAIPYVLMGRDVLGCAQTGTGKTAGFTLPMIEILSSGRAKARMPRSLILEPTRELAAQVAENFDAYGKYTKLTKALLIGGVSYDDQERLLDRGVDVLIATPGRLLDHFERGRILLADVKILVIDEADRMLDMGFIPDVEKIVGLLPPLRQTLFFSATMAPDVRRLADKFLSNPKEISVAPPASTGATIVQALAMVPGDDWQKREALRRLLKAEPVRNALIFCNRKRDVDTLYKSLKKHGFNAGALHGDMDQSTRTETLDAFKRGAITLLVCSDVAARGLDIDDMSHVFNFDVPIHAEDYVHRIGRTGRAGRTGHSFTLGTYDDGKFIAAIERLIGKPIPRMVIDGMAADAAPAADEQHEKRGRGGRRSGRDGRDGRSPRGERGGRSRHSEPRPEVQAEAVQEPPPAAQPQPPRPTAVPPMPRQDQRREAPQGRERHRDRERDDGPTPIGMGDHVPAFLLRGRRAVG
jgi:superfamily II DNA/RNA helicase